LNSTFVIGLLGQQDFTLEPATKEKEIIGAGLLEQIVSFIEITCCNSVSSDLHQDEITIAKGINITGDLDYADYLGNAVSISTELLEFENNFLAFRIQVDSHSKQINTGIHVRTLVKRS